MAKQVHRSEIPEQSHIFFYPSLPWFPFGFKSFIEVFMCALCILCIPILSLAIQDGAGELITITTIITEKSNNTNLTRIMIFQCISITKITVKCILFGIMPGLVQAAIHHTGRSNHRRALGVPSPDIRSQSCL